MPRENQNREDGEPNLGKHPSKDIISSLSERLKGKRIALCVTGSVAAVQAPEIARLMMRHGAEVYPIMSTMAQRIIHPDVMTWATGNPTVTELTGRIEHVAIGGLFDDSADLILVAPATANTISKIACGIDDTPVTSVVTTAFGAQKPIMIAPAMHESMFRHPILNQHIASLKSLGVEFVEPRAEEGKAKIAEPQEIVSRVIRKLVISHDFEGLRILVTAGSTAEHIDPVRIITNKSSGKMGMAIAKEATDRGAKVTIIYGTGYVPVPTEANVIRVESTEQMRSNVLSELKRVRYDCAFAVAAAADWIPEKPSPTKISTHAQKELVLKLKPTPKIIDEIKRVSPNTFLIAFKAEHNIPERKLIDCGHERLLESGADLIVVNDVGIEGSGFNAENNEVFVIDKKKRVVHIQLTLKKNVAEQIMNVVRQKMKTE